MFIDDFMVNLLIDLRTEYRRVCTPNVVFRLSCLGLMNPRWRSGGAKSMSASVPPLKCTLAHIDRSPARRLGFFNLWQTLITTVTVGGS